jgi:hypothetical protein
MLLWYASAELGTNFMVSLDAGVTGRVNDVVSMAILERYLTK